MVLAGKTAAEKHYVMGDITEDQIQPNGVDLRVDTVYEITGRAYLGEDSVMDFQNMRKKKVLQVDGEFILEAGRHYAVDFKESVSVPDGYCGIIYPRSSLLRAGAFVTSALWDTGFQGSLGGFIRPLCDIYVAEGARLAQIVFTKAEFSGHRYDGRYQGATSQVIH